ncbi:MAG: hypothetical protein AB7I04_02710 [Pseudomonadales bacterium]
MSEPGAAAGGAAPEIRLSPKRIATGSVLLFLVAFVLLAFARLAKPATWEFGLEVDTEVAALTLQPDTMVRWRIDGAQICSRTALVLPEASRLADAAAVCGGRRWQGWQLEAPEQVLTLSGGASVLLETTTDGLSLSLRAAEGQTLGSLEAVGSVAETTLGDALNLFWRADSSVALSFPFTATTTLGRAVSWADPRMLRSGTVSVFTADDSADQRTRVDEAGLMLGDQVTLSAETGGLWPKGFVRPTAGMASLAVVAFGQADSLSIVRYGESGYDFRPDWFARLASDPILTFWGSLLAVYMSIALGVVQFSGEKSIHRDDPRATWFRWFYRYDE